jgi:hypothetical protein
MDILSVVEPPFAQRAETQPVCRLFPQFKYSISCLLIQDFPVLPLIIFTGLS